uniref:Uncharacterized protein n=1 Tax=Anguilla anguilla TaxID=7936 RepID=A0A0E9SYX0_ANGAN
MQAVLIYAVQWLAFLQCICMELTASFRTDHVAKVTQ